ILDKEGNTITGNHGAGISFTMQDQGLGSANIIGNTIQNTAAGQAPQNTSIFTGQGIDLRLTGSTVASNSVASFTGGTIDKNTIGGAGNGNAGSGIVVFADQKTSLQNLNIGTVGQGNIIASNGGSGISMTRNNTSQVGNLIPVVITDNNIRLNGANGVALTAQNSFGGVVNGFSINRNNIRNNVLDGIRLHVEADAQMRVNILDNTISNNTIHGIHSTELTATAGDLRRVLGQWSGNTITFNGGDGINLAGATGSLASRLEIGSLATPSDGNIISNNGSHGIFVTAPSRADYGFNTIDSNAAGGIYLHSLPNNNFLIHNNVVTNNGTFSAAADGGDGIQIVNNYLFTGFTSSVTMTSNTIRDNAGRGVNILNQGNGILTADLQSNLIISNRMEGVYVVNTASTAQSADVLSTVAMDATGSIFSVPIMNLTLNSNVIEGNGISSATSANGLVVRVGTSDGGRSFIDNGGFASDGRGGIVATVTNNLFGGNLGADVFFQSFVSTVNPATTGGTWNATTFTPSGYQSDPLARLDLSFHNNIGDELAVNQLGAIYANAEVVFKTRDTAQTDPGPFFVGQTLRNAERLGARFLLPPATPGGLSNTFLYSGIGQSTFRLLSASSSPIGATTAADAAGAGFSSGGFFLDADPYTGPGSASGVGIPNLTDPFGWTFSP
ncbi:MAG: right-handed parallel beta-helix repeat-containing protein, partial [Planctomycetia bacterium]|nr:right-handed parallel beta-helix repeat-containing protein [Planctomycetia bacterium]